MRGLHALFLAGALMAAMATTPLAAQTAKTSMTRQEQANVKLALDWWREGFVAGHADVVDKYLAADMIQHNPNMPNGNSGIKTLLSRRTPVNPIPDKLTPEQTPVIAIGQGDIVTLMFDHEAKDPADPSKTYHYNSFDTFRVKDGKFVEHWDGATKTAQSPAKESPAEAAETSLGKMSRQEAANQKLVLDWWRAFQSGHAEMVPQFFAADVAQHNPNFPSGSKTIQDMVSRRKRIDPMPEKLTPEQTPAITMSRGDIVFLMFDHTGKDPSDPSKTYHYNSFDAFRVKDGKITDHWDGAQKTTPGRGRAAA